MYTIILFSDSYKHFLGSIEEYEKRLGKDINIIKLKPSKRKNISEIVLEETLVLQEKLQKMKGMKILLYITGTQISTEQFFEMIELKKQQYSDIVFIVGGAYGVQLDLIDTMIDYKMSFSPMTFPHSVAYLLLLEQIYRISMMKKGSGYHH